MDIGKSYQNIVGGEASKPMLCIDYTQGYFPLNNASTSSIKYFENSSCDTYTLKNNIYPNSELVREIVKFTHVYLILLRLCVKPHVIPMDCDIC